MKLHAKLVAALVPLITLPMVALGWVAYTQQRDSVQSELLRQLRTRVEQIDREFHARLNAVRADTLLFSNSSVLKRYLLVESEAQRYRLLQPGLLKLFATYQDANPEYFEIRILLPDGYEDTRATTRHIDNVSDDEAASDYFEGMTEATDDILVQVAWNPDIDMPSVIASSRIALSDYSVDPILARPTLRGYLVVSMGLDFIADYVEDTLDGGSVLFTDATGRPLFVPGVATHGFAGTHMPGTALRHAAGDGSARPIRIGYQDQVFRVTGRRMDDNLFVFAALSESKLLASTRHLTKVAVMLTLASLTCTAALLYAILRSLLLTPLARLGEATREIARGNLVTEVGIRRPDELGDLARSFEVMSLNLRKSHDQIAFLAYHDSLTGLPNRRLFGELLERAIASAERDDQVLAILFLDLDDFKRVNDSLGHQVGDQMLNEVSERLSAVVRPCDWVSHEVPRDHGNTVARLGGDEFIVLLSALPTPLHAANVASRILDELARPICVGGNEIHASTSIGITTCPGDGRTAETLIKNADIAMYHAKTQGKNHYQFYAETMNKELVGRLALERSLREALTRQEFVLHYQPQVDTRNGDMIGVEALVRWIHPETGMIPPADFIPLAEETGLIVPLSEWVLREACRQNKAWQDAGLPPVTVAVNISARQFVREDLESTVRRVLAQTGLEARYLDIELTESSVMQAPEQAAQTLRALKTLGVKISLDDFGMGYSSLSALKRLPIDCLKIDQSFVRDITSNDDDAAITSTIIAMGRSLNLTVVAEGVERVDQFQFLRARGCDRVQGYLISRPVPADQIEASFLVPGPAFPVDAQLFRVTSGNTLLTALRPVQ